MAGESNVVTKADPNSEVEAAKESFTERGVKLAGEAVVVPGASLFLDGRVLLGSVHVAAAFAAKMALGPLGWALVAANSYSRSVTGKHLPGFLMQQARERKA